MTIILYLFFGVLILTIPFTIVWFIEIHINYSVHLSMTRSHSRVQGRGTFEDFVHYFNSYKMKPMRGHSGSYKDEENDCEYFASIIKFEGKGFLSKNMIEHRKIVRYVKKYSETESSSFNKLMNQEEGKDGYYIELSGNRVFVSKDEIYKKIH